MTSKDRLAEVVDKMKRYSGAAFLITRFNIRLRDYQYEVLGLELEKVQTYRFLSRHIGNMSITVVITRVGAGRMTCALLIYIWIFENRHQ